MLAEHYQKTKKSFQKRLVKGTKIFQKKKKKRRVNMIVNNIKKFQRLKSKGWLSISIIISRSKSTQT